MTAQNAVVSAIVLFTNRSRIAQLTTNNQYPWAYKEVFMNKRFFISWLVIFVV
jgi:hypothetical protein